MGMFMQNENAEKNEEKSLYNGHPFDFQVSGPRNLSTPSWRDIIQSSWKDDNYKRAVLACLVRAMYLLEVDRQEKLEGDAAWAPKWCKPFKYKVVELLVDERDGSIFGARLEWDAYAALSDLLVMRPSKAPKAIIALRGTMLRFPTIRVDIEDDIRIFTTDDLSGSYRFRNTMEAVRTAVGKYGISEVCIAGHSLGAALVLQVGRALALEGIVVESHLFNPPSFSLPNCLRSIGDNFKMLCNVVKDMTSTILPFMNNSNQELVGHDKQLDDEEEGDSVDICQESQEWVPHIYVNCRDYICCDYSDSCKRGDSDSCKIRRNCDEDEEKSIQFMPEESRMNNISAKLYVISNGPMEFLEAHRLKQWWSHESKLLMEPNGSKLIQQQLGSLIQRSDQKTALEF